MAKKNGNIRDFNFDSDVVEYVTSDQHFFHKNIIRYCNRPKQHNALMIKGWNETFCNKDNVVLYNLGDVFPFIRDDKKMKIVLNKLYPVKTHLILGNHDNNNGNFYVNKLGYESAVRNHIRLLRDNLTIILSHHPLEVDELMTYKAIETDRVVNIHGHTHNNYSTNMYHENGIHVNVSVEVTEYKPVAITDIVNELIKQC